MKPNVLLPVATALIGFSLAWIAKPGGTTAATPTEKAEPAAPVKSPRTEANPRTSSTSSTSSKRPVEVKISDFPLVDQAEKGPKTGEEAKMLRLSEALGLSFDQQSSLIQLVTDSQAKMNMDLSAIEDLATRGKGVEEGLRKIFTPDQFAKFQEIQDRLRDNRTEIRAQKQLAEAIEIIDLSPEQREEVASRLRQKSKADLQAIPAAATLLFSNSLLPGSGKELNVDGVLMLNQMGEKAVMGNPNVVHQNVMNRHKQELEEILKCFDGILTPAQMGQYQASIAEKREIMERLRMQTLERQESLQPPPEE